MLSHGFGLLVLLCFQDIEWTHIDYFNNAIICDLIENVSTYGFKQYNLTLHANDLTAVSAFLCGTTRLGRRYDNPHLFLGS